MQIDLQIKRKLLKVLQDHAGCWTEQEFRQIEAGTLELQPYLQDLIRAGYVYHDRVAAKYVLTDMGGRHLAELSAVDTSDP